MKNSAQERLAFEKMMPGAVTALGFLGDDHRSLTDIITEDEQAFAALRLDFAEVAQQLRTLRDAGGDGLGEPVTVMNRWIVQTGDARGVLPCPWGDGVFHKNGISVRKVDPGKPLESCVDGEDILIFSDLSIHMLEAHHFLQGRGSPFRLDPHVLKNIL